MCHPKESKLASSTWTFQSKSASPSKSSSMPSAIRPVQEKQKMCKTLTTSDLTLPQTRKCDSCETVKDSQPQLWLAKGDRSQYTRL